MTRTDALDLLADHLLCRLYMSDPAEHDNYRAHLDTTQELWREALAVLGVDEGEIDEAAWSVERQAETICNRAKVKQ